MLTRTDFLFVVVFAMTQLACEAGSNALPDVTPPENPASAAPGLRGQNSPLIVGWAEPIRDRRKWLNPLVTIRAEGVEVESHELPLGRQTIAAGHLRALLEGLPASAWPDGRVVRASDIGIRSVDRRDDERIKRNHDEAERILRALEIEIVWIPS
jgi:hypothetical protein